MGGYGSGRPGWKRTAESSKRVETGYLYRQGMLSPGRRSTLSWTRGDEPAGDIRLEAEEGRIVLVYRTRRNGGEWQSVREPVSIIWTPCNYGGERP